jgi:hypothetical protein
MVLSPSHLPFRYFLPNSSAWLIGVGYWRCALRSGRAWSQ